MTKTFCDVCAIQCDGKWGQFQVPANATQAIDGRAPSLVSPMVANFNGEVIEAPIRRVEMQVCLKCLQELNRTVGEKVWEMMDRHGGNPLKKHLKEYPPNESCSFTPRNKRPKGLGE